jgi:cytoskeletal protein CcmA (bactofilin family)
MSRFVMSEKTIISAGSALRGLVRGQGDLRVEGQCFGDIEVTGLVEIAEGARVKATVRGARVVVSGAVSGDLYATESISLEAGARVVGNLSAPSVGIGEGALVRGRVETGLAPETVAPRAIGRSFHHTSAASSPTAGSNARASASPGPARAATPAARAPSPRNAGSSSTSSSSQANARATGGTPGGSPFAGSSSSLSQAPTTQAAARSPSVPSTPHSNTNAGSLAGAPTVAAPSPTSLGSALPPEERKAPPPVVPSLKKGHKASFKKKAGG